MTAIQSLLNPLLEKKYDTTPPPSPSIPRHLPSPSLSICRKTPRTLSPSPNLQSHKKQKISKDQAIFTRGQIRGECRYPPYEEQNDLLAAHHQQFEMHPIGQIADFARHVPYNSEKKAFEGKTGRQCFEVFQYNFRIPGDEKVHCMMWDYNIGLVRTTPLFRCMGYSKTTPAKMLNRNPGLRDICHSITGGALVAQGYWMPYEAARAIATTFCYRMRYALTPVFGLDFPDACIPPTSDHYGEMIIDNAITKYCTEQAAHYRLLELESRYASARGSPLLVCANPLTPDTPIPCTPFKQLRPKTLKLNTSGYSTGPETSSVHDNLYAVSSAAKRDCYHNVWTPANTPSSSNTSYLLSPRVNFTDHAERKVRSGSNEISSPELSPKSMQVPKHERAPNAVNATDDGDSCDEDAKTKLGQRGRISSDEKAAYLLMGLRLQKCREMVEGTEVEQGKMSRAWRKRRATG